jgi:cellobiose transport system substrate-binding protein
MPRSSTRRRGAALLAVAALGAFVLAGCGSSNSSASAGDSAAAGPCGTTDDTTLTVGLFGTFGFKEAGLWDAYHKVCPNITIKEDDVEQSADYWTRLKTRLASGSGLDDVQGIEIGFVADVVAHHADQFVNFASLPGGKAVTSTFYPWKNAMATTSDGRQIGLGTDAGPEAMCYRRDLFKKAGLPTNPATLSKDWSTWGGFLALGRQYEASATKQANSHFLDSSASIFSASVYQGSEAYDNSSGQPDTTNSDGVKAAWGFASQAAAQHLTAGLAQFSTPWNQAFANGAFATLSCPAWMLGYIKSEAGKTGKATWDVAALPGQYSNWGGSWLGVPTASKHQAAAEALAEWLTAPAQQVTMWTSQQHFPSSQVAAQDPSVANATSAYFSGAPIGKIFGTSAAALTRTPIGPFDTQIQSAFTTALTSIETKGTSPSSAFSDAQKNIKEIVGG